MPVQTFLVCLYSMAFLRRLKKEYEEISKRPPDGIVLDDGTMQDEVDM